VELSSIVNQLALSKEENRATKKELNTLKELFDNCKEQKMNQANILERVEIKLQAANQQLDEQSKEFKNIRNRFAGCLSRHSRDALRRWNTRRARLAQHVININFDTKTFGRHYRFRIYHGIARSINSARVGKEECDLQKL
jgi:small-conductance mechanosensitive channel